MTERKFLEAVAAAPFDDSLRLVWADEQLEREAPRAEAIALEHALPALEPDRRAHATLRLEALTASHGAAWAGPLAPFLDLPSSTFRLGFVDTAVISWKTSPKELRAVVGDPAWRTVRRVVFTWYANDHDGAHRRTPEAVTQHQLLEKLPWLQGMGGVLPGVLLRLEPNPTLTALHLRLRTFPASSLFIRIAQHSALKRLGIHLPSWSPPQQMAPLWRPLTPKGLELLSLECIGRAPGWARLARELAVPRFAVQTAELGNAWFVTRKRPSGLQLDFYLPDAGYLAETGLRVLEDLPTRDFSSLVVWVPGALHVEHEARLRQALARFSKAERAMLPGRLKVNPVFE